MVTVLLRGVNLAYARSMGVSPKGAATETRRLSREDFLARALEVLSKDGESELRIDRLVKAIGVTKGSFYWHFENRLEFVHSLAEYWKRWSTDRVITEIGDSLPEPKATLRKIHEIVSREDLIRYDLVMRSWATHEPEVARAVDSVDRTRSAFVRHQFERLGFRGQELEMRTRTFVVTTSMWAVVHRDETTKARLQRLGAVLEMLTR